MLIGRVKGNVVATQKTAKVGGQKLLVVETYSLDATGKSPKLKGGGKVLVAVDTVGAGDNEYVLITQGSSARLTEFTGDMPVDAVIVGIIDRVTVEGETIYKDEDQD
ncbi:MAG: EutN/CcmL family microcompartment protein [Phycisphaerae bacterium]|nr:EutN/CcmL family microcompartment protein [Phycisphaerae bacterium]